MWVGNLSNEDKKKNAHVFMKLRISVLPSESTLRYAAQQVNFEWCPDPKRSFLRKMLLVLILSYVLCMSCHLPDKVSLTSQNGIPGYQPFICCNCHSSSTCINHLIWPHEKSFVFLCAWFCISFERLCIYNPFLYQWPKFVLCVFLLLFGIKRWGCHCSFLTL